MSPDFFAAPERAASTVVGEGNTYEEAMADVRSAIQLHLETFGNEVLPDDSPVLEVFIAEATVAV